MNKMTIKLVSAISIMASGAVAFGADAPAPAPTPAAAAADASTNGIGPKIQFATPVYDFGKAKSGDPVKYTYIVNNMDDPLSVWGPESNNKSFTAVLKTNAPGTNYEVTVSAVPPLQPGSVQAQINLKTSATNSQTISFTAWANVQQPFTINPPQI